MYQNVPNFLEWYMHEKRPGWPAEINDEELKKLVESNIAQTISEFTVHMGFSIDTISRYLKIMEKFKKLNQWVPYKLDASTNYCV